MENENFMTVRITLEMKLYKGRLLDDVNDPTNYHFAIRDQFSGILKFPDTLRPGEYIDLISTEQL